MKVGRHVTMIVLFGAFMAPTVAFAYFQSSYYGQGSYYSQSYYQSTYYTQSYYQGYYQGSYGTTFTGDVEVKDGAGVTGAISKGSGTFVIDHPLNPKEELLYHSFVESPDVKNLYDGIVELDANGRATIELPGYFLALNKDFRYLATPLGEAMPELRIAHSVRKRFLGLFGTPVFAISGGSENGRVSWQVTGTRRDPYIRVKPIVNELEKGPNMPVGKGECLFAPLCRP